MPLWERSARPRHLSSPTVVEGAFVSSCVTATGILFWTTWRRELQGRERGLISQRGCGQVIACSVTKRGIRGVYSRDCTRVRTLCVFVCELPI